MSDNQTITDQYIALGKAILAKVETSDAQTARQGVGTYRLTEGVSLVVPAGDLGLILCNKLYTRSCMGELLWMISGDTNARSLHKPEFGKSHIWDKDAEAFRKRRAAAGMLAYPEGELGYVYGSQWRKFGVTYAEQNDNPDGVWPTADQLTNLIDLLRRSPTTRQAIVTAFNPALQTPLLAALPPCHTMFQVLIDGEPAPRVNMIMTQRSADVLVGLPWNILNYSVLLHMIVDLLNRDDEGKRLETPKYALGTLRINIGDAHIYESHVESVRAMVASWEEKRDDMNQWTSTLKIIGSESPKYLQDYELKHLEILLYRQDDEDDYDDILFALYKDVEIPKFSGELHC